jgi:hypothetical protein
LGLINLMVNLKLVDHTIIPMQIISICNAIILKIKVPEAFSYLKI